MTTILSLLEEMQTWLNFSQKIQAQASASHINTKTNKEFDQLVKDWGNGLCDNDPQYVGDKIESLLFREFKS
jgi:hypothetical protein